MFDGIVEFIRSLLNILIQPVLSALHAVRLIGAGADIAIFGITQELFPPILCSAISLLLVGGIIKFIWHY